ncbi:TetR/AcrR family transcriptional regulator [Pseudomonas segetis]|uniref:Transcriptional regulator, TetR family n=1 Tax=Pseudomonas segetis TaxID=298908 RepID=A0A238ZKL2_9PSED|nr:transcriptional regulator, TetR family [Pseudomonas segetis]
MKRVMTQDDDSFAATAVTDNIQYQGRKASRAGSEKRRQAILEAALRIIVRDGVRAVRHRAVAAEAQVPLSATTYYFKDINDLISDTFTLFVERCAANQTELWSSNDALLQERVSHFDGSPARLRAFADEVAQMAVAFVRSQLIDRRDHLLAEQAFRHEALLNPRLHDLVRAQAQIVLHGATRFFAMIGSKHPAEDAILLTTAVERMEYRGLIEGVDALDIEAMLAILKRYLYLVLGV